MGLYIRSDEVNELADELARLKGQKKSDAVRQALSEAIERAKETPTLMDEIGALQERVKAKGFRRMPDEKQFLDDMWGRL